MAAAKISSRASTASGLCICSSVAALAWLAERQVGGFTGDVLGAQQQAAEIAVLAAAAAAL